MVRDVATTTASDESSESELKSWRVLDSRYLLSRALLLLLAVLADVAFVLLDRPVLGAVEPGASLSLSSKSIAIAVPLLDPALLFVRFAGAGIFQSHKIVYGWN